MYELDMPGLQKTVEQLHYSPYFVTVSGAHLYGFPSQDSDVDLRGCHGLELDKLVGLDMPPLTYEFKTMLNGSEVELVSHDIAKYFKLMVQNNGYILEQILSPIVIVGQSFLDGFKPLARDCITKHHYHHYRGFYATQRKLLEKEMPKRVKPLLYAYRVLMTGIHLLQTGDVEANLLFLNEHFHFSFLHELVQRKIRGENIALSETEWGFHENRLAVLEKQLDEAFCLSSLQEKPNRQAVNDFLVRLRLVNHA